MRIEPIPLAFIYDRHATPTEGVLLLRLEANTQYVQAQGWELAGEWVDRGDEALTDDHRPKFEEMLKAIGRAAQNGRKAVCLVSSWDRFSRSDWERRIFVRKVTLAGGWVQTIVGESSRDPSGTLTKAPLW